MTLESYLRELQHLLGLNHWEIEIIVAQEDVLQDDNNNIMAEVVKTPDRPTVRIIFYPAFFSGSLEQQRHYLVHELLHLHLNRLWKHIPYVEDVLGRLAYELWSEAARSDMEEVVDALAYVFEPMAPLPSRHLVQFHLYDKAIAKEEGTKTA